MKKAQKTIRVLMILGMLGILSCSQGESETRSENSETNPTEQLSGQSGVKDDISNPNVVQIAAGSKDHTTLVAAVKAAGLVDALANAGPFTVFAPVNTAFDKLPAGTVETLLKPEKKDDLVNILEYHVYVGVIKAENLRDGQQLGQVNGGNVKITMANGKPVLNGKARIIASVPASNGVIHVIDEVLLPQ